MKLNLITKDSTIEQAFAFFFLTKTASGIKQATIDGYNAFYKNFCLFLAGAGTDEKTATLHLFEVSSSALDVLFRDYLERRNFKPTTISRYMILYNAFYRYLADDLEVLPHKKMKIKVAIPPIKNLLTEDQLRQLIKPFKHYERFAQYQGWVVANFILNTGARKSNLVNLKMSDLHRLDEGIVRFGTTKNGKPQLIFVPAETCAILKKWCGIWRSDAKPDDYVFCDTKGNQSTGYGIGARYIEFLEKNCEEGFPTSLHLLRHQYASMFLSNGGSIYDLKRQLGHSSFAMVQWYADHYADPNIANMEAFTPSRTLRQNEKLKPKIGKKK